MQNIVTCDKLPSSYFRDTDTDKVSSEFHDYSNIYDIVMVFLLSQTSNPVRVLEIGTSLFSRGSGHAFCEMPYVEKYVGIDIEECQFNEKGVFIKGDAYSPAIVKQARAHGPYDLLIDDAWHSIQQQTDFFKLYRQLCSSPSVMICEDVSRKMIDEIFVKVADPTLHIITCPATNHARTDNHLLVKFNYG